MRAVATSRCRHPSKPLLNRHRHAAQGVRTLSAFDLDIFLDSAERTHKWQCPHTLFHGCVQELQTDAFVQQILDCLQVLSPEPVRPVSCSADKALPHWRS